MRSGASIMAILALLLSITVAAGTSMAVDFQGEAYIEEGDFHAVLFTAEEAGIYRFSVNSESGHGVAILIMDTANYHRYGENQTFEYEDYSAAVSMEKRVALLTGSYYFVLDNSERIAPDPVTGISVEYSMYEEFPFGELFDSLMIIGLVSIGVIVVVIAVLFYFLRKDEGGRRETMQMHSPGGETKYCIHCGRQIPSDSTICPYCDGRN